MVRYKSEIWCEGTREDRQSRRKQKKSLLKSSNPRHNQQPRASIGPICRTSKVILIIEEGGGGTHGVLTAYRAEVAVGVKWVADSSDEGTKEDTSRGSHRLQGVRHWTGVSTLGRAPRAMAGTAARGAMECLLHLLHDSNNRKTLPNF